jgi:hypothetical protein
MRAARVSVVRRVPRRPSGHLCANERAGNLRVDNQQVGVWSIEWWAACWESNGEGGEMWMG